MKNQLFILSTCFLLANNPLNAANYICDVCQDRKNYTLDEDLENQSSSTNPESDKRKAIHQADHVLLDKIHDSVESNGGYKKCKDVNIRVSDGNVTLTGTIKNEQDRVFIVERVKKSDKDRFKRLNEVKSVNDQLVTHHEARTKKATRLLSEASSIREQATQPANYSPGEIDRHLLIQVEKKLKESLKEDENSVNAEIQNGVVTLSGIVTSDNIRRSIEQEVRETPGVKGTNNQVKVSPPLKAQ